MVIPVFTSFYSVLELQRFMCTVLSNPNTEWKNMLFFSFQDSFNQVITGKNIETVFMVLSAMSNYKDMM